MKKRVLIIILILLIGAFSYWWGDKHDWGKTASRLMASGTVEATTVNVDSKLSGTIESLLVVEGDQVTAGQLLFTLTRNDLKAQVERDILGVQIARSQLNDLLAGVRPEEMAEAQAQLKMAETDLAQSEQDLQRLEQLYAADGLALSDLEHARLTRQLKAAQVETAQARVNLLLAGNRADTIAAAKAELERNQAVLKASQVLLSDLDVYAPLSGTVLTKNFEPGEYVVPGTPVLTIADLDHLWIKVYIPTDDLPKIQLGQIVEISVSGYEFSFSGRITHIASQGEFTPKTIQTAKERTNIVFAVKIEVEDNKDGIIKPGMPADVFF